MEMVIRLKNFELILIFKIIIYFFQLEYRMTLDTIKLKTLQATVWATDRFQENLFLGAVTLPLEKVDLTRESPKWYKLTNFHRLSR